MDNENTIEYWKSQYDKLEKEYNDFCQSSSDLEHELNLEIDQLTQKNHKLGIEIDRLNIDLETIKLRFKDTNSNQNKQINELTDECNRLKSEKGTLQKYVRELEQNNDDLERAYRITLGTLSDFEDQLNKAIEKNAILENELEEKDSMMVMVQRLKDEARDLRQDLEVKEVTIQSCRKSQVDEALVTSMIEEQSSIHPPLTQTDLSLSNENSITPSDSIDSIGGPNSVIGQSNSFLPNGGGPIKVQRTSSSSKQQLRVSRSEDTEDNAIPSMNYMNLTPNARISALNLVTDMLKKVGQIESKLSMATYDQSNLNKSPGGGGGDGSNQGRGFLSNNSTTTTSNNSTVTSQSQRIGLSHCSSKLHSVNGTGTVKLQYNHIPLYNGTNLTADSNSIRQFNGYDRSPKPTAKVSLQ